MGAIDFETLKANWDEQLAHQISNLPPVETFIDDLKDQLHGGSNQNLLNRAYSPCLKQRGHFLLAHFSQVERGKPLDKYGSNTTRSTKQTSCFSFVPWLNTFSRTLLTRYPSTGNEILHVWEVEKMAQCRNSQKL